MKNNFLIVFTHIFLFCLVNLPLLLILAVPVSFFVPGDGLTFFLVLSIQPISALVLIIGAPSTFILGLLTKTRDLVFISAIPTFALIYTMAKTHSFSLPGNLIYIRLMKIYMNNCPWWVYVGYTFLVWINFAYWIKQSSKKSQSLTA
jgi:hypothetical protein